MTQTVHIYIRFSNLEQGEGTSTARQEEDCRAHLMRKGWSLDTILIDEGRSAFTGDNRSPGAKLNIFENEALAGMHSGEILLVERLDRLSRQGYEETYDLVRRLSRAGVHVATVDGDEFYEAGAPLRFEQVMMMVMKAELAREESEKKSQRLKRRYELRRADAAATGRPMSKNGPAWLTLEDGRYVIDEAKAKIVRDIFAQADAGDGSLVIAKRLNRTGVATWEKWGRKATHWDHARVAKLLRDGAVIGEYQPHIMINGKRTLHGEPIKLYPSIVDADVFARVRSTAIARKLTKGGGHSGTVINLVSGFARCSECGETMGYKAIKAAGTTYVAKPSGNVLTLKQDAGALVCRTASNHGPCSNKAMIAYTGFERALLDALLPLALDDTAFIARDDMAALNRAIAERSRDAEHARCKAERLWNAFAESGSPMSQKMAQDAEADATKIDGDIATLERQRETMQDQASGAERLSRIAAIRKHMHDDDLEVRATHRRKVMESIRSVCETITCHPDKTVKIAMVRGMRLIAITPGRGRAPSAIEYIDLVKPHIPHIGETMVEAGVRERIRIAKGW